ncbi:MAG: TetR family transcriptional regulator [Pseudonocardia sp.]|nr:TetR family transcriptional regulator [Pseudonocardia sp.]
MRPDQPYTVALMSAWTFITGPEGQPYLRMFGQLRDSAAQQLLPDFRRMTTTDWLGPLEEGLRSIDRPELATLVLAVIRGLLMDLDATAERVMARVELNDTAGPACELALQPGRGARVLGAHEVRRGNVVPGSRSNRLPGHLHTLTGEMSL